MAKKKTKRARTIDWQKMLLTDTTPWSIQEAYRALRTNVMFSLPGNESKVIGVTSSNRSAGKSVTSINLATSLTQVGKRVVIVDGDLRLPTVAMKSGVQGEPGLSNIIIGEASLSDCIVLSPLLGDLHILPAGKIPPDPTWLLSSQQMEDIFVGLKEYYDYIVVDLPPVNMVTDSSILSKYIDGYLVVVRHNETEYPELNETLNQLTFANAKILGFVYNDAPVHSKKGNYYYYAKK